MKIILKCSLTEVEDSSNIVNYQLTSFIATDFMHFGIVQLIKKEWQVGKLI